MSYRGKVTRTGNSRGFRFASALFQSHPEFAEGDVEATVIAPGRLLVQMRTPQDDRGEDPVFEAYLSFLESQLVRQPALLQPFTAHELSGVEELLEGVTYDPDEVLDDDFELP
jgi:hypothetical protein